MLGTPTWPPPDTDRNRFLFRLGVPLGVLASAYVLTFGLISDGWLPLVVAVLLIAATLMGGIGLLLMRAERRGSRADGEPGVDEPGVDEPAGDEPGRPARDEPAGLDVRPRPRPRPAPNAR